MAKKAARKSSHEDFRAASLFLAMVTGCEGTTAERKNLGRQLNSYQSMTSAI